MTSNGLCNYCTDEGNDNTNENNATNYGINGHKTTASRSFEFKTKIIRSIPADNNALVTEVPVSLKHLNTFWIALGLSFINCKTELDLWWEIYWITCYKSRTCAATVGTPSTWKAGLKFQINSLTN